MAWNGLKTLSHPEVIHYFFQLETNSLSTAWKVSKYGVISGPYFPVFGLNTGKYGPEITPCLDTFHKVQFTDIHNAEKSVRRSLLFA